MKSLKLHKSTRLFYNQYLYKLVLRNPLAHLFRSDLQREGLSFAKEKLDAYTLKYKLNKPLIKQTYRASVEISADEYLDAMDIYNSLENSSEYKLRCESQTVGIYSNDRNLLKSLANKIRNRYVDFWEPEKHATEFLRKNHNIKLVSTPNQYQYQLHLRYTSVDSSVGNWVENNKDKVKVGPKTLADLHRGFANGSYLYVRDDKVLVLVELLIGHAIRKIDKIVYTGDIDKYKYDS